MPCPDDDECCVIKPCPEATENVPKSEQPDGESKPSVKVQTARRMGAKVAFMFIQLYSAWRFSF